MFEPSWLEEKMLQIIHVTYVDDKRVESHNTVDKNDDGHGRINGRHNHNKEHLDCI